MSWASTVTAFLAAADQHGDDLQAPRRSLKKARRRRRPGDSDWIAPMAAKHPDTTRTIIIVCVVGGVGILLALLSCFGYRKWASRKRKENPGWRLRDQLLKRKLFSAAAVAAQEEDDVAMVHETRVADQHDVDMNRRPALLLHNAAGSKSRKQAAASREP